MLKRFAVGGEFLIHPRLLFGPYLGQFSKYGLENTGYYRQYTFGAYYSLKVIIEHLRMDSIQTVLLPSYLCPSIIRPFREAGVSYEFYKLKEGLLPDLGDIDRKAGPGLKAILFIDYFGFPQKDYLTEIVSHLRQRGVKILQDIVQSWVNNENYLYGDYCFNSLRKYTPYEASVLMSRECLCFNTSLKPILPFLTLKRLAQVMRYLHLETGLLFPEAFLGLLDKANACYHQPGVIGMPGMNRCILDKIDFALWGRQRRSVFKLILNSSRPNLIIKRELGNVVPLGMAVYLQDRDAKKLALHKLGVHCPLHWLLPEEIDRKEHEYSWDLQKHALTLPLVVDPQFLGKYLCTIHKIINGVKFESDV